ncbi:MAG TPA: hypothetical protein VN329_02750 [Roseomonas sp.]|nr:hypothetical protein [Roseomonas sp.]
MNATDAVQRTRANLRRDQPPETLLTNFQRRVVLALFGAGIAYLLVGLLLLPHGAVFWLGFVVLPPLAGGLAAIFGGGPGQRFDAWLLNGGAAKQDPKATPATALPEAARSALQVAAVPALLGELVRAGAAMPAAEKAAAGRLFRAVIAFWNSPADSTARAALARELPGLVAGLATGGTTAIAAADAAVLKLAPPAGGAA